MTNVATLAAVRTRDPDLDRWWSPPQLAKRWRLDPKTVRAYLNRINSELGFRLFPEGTKSIRVLGSALNDALPGCFTREKPEAGRLTDIRSIVARLDEIDAWRDSFDEWRESATMAIRESRLARTG